MQAVRWHGRLDVRLDEVAAPGPARPGMAIVRVSLCGICGTDIAEYLHGPVLIGSRPHPLTGRQPPVTLGHEFVGVVEALGEGAQGVAVGDRVTADACWRCQSCARCRRGDYHLCAQGGSVGLHSDGGLAPLVEVPAYCLVRVPDAVDDELAAMTEPFAVGLHAVERASVEPDDVVTVVGFGTIGMAASWWALRAGALVVVAEPSEARRAAATRMGAQLVLNPTAVSVRDEVRSFSQSDGADRVIDCTGVAALVPSSLDLTRRGGVAVITGVTRSITSLDPSRLVLFERELRGALGYHGHLPQVLGVFADPNVDRPIVDVRTLALAEAVTAAFVSGSALRETVQKVMVRCT